MKDHWFEEDSGQIGEINQAEEVNQSQGPRKKKAKDKQEVRQETSVPYGTVLPQNAEEREFGMIQTGFPVTRRPKASRRAMATNYKDAEEWIAQRENLLGDPVKTESERKKAVLLLYTWREVFVDEVISMPKTDLVQHYPTYPDAVPRSAKAPLFNLEETDWQKENVPSLEESLEISRCISPWTRKSKFVRKRDGKLRLVNALIRLNKATIKANYPAKRMETVLQRLSKSGIKYYFYTDAANRY